MPIKSGPPDKPTFVCDRCGRLMCKDCASIAAEYEYLYQRQKAELMEARRREEEAERERAMAAKRAEDYERIMKLGQHALILAWMDSQTTGELLENVESAARNVRR